MIKPVKYSADHNESRKLFGSNTLNILTTSRQLNDKATAGNTEVAKRRRWQNFTSDDNNNNKKKQSYETVSKTLQLKRYLETQAKTKMELEMIEHE